MGDSVMRMSVTIDGASHEVAVKPADLVAFERKFDVSWADTQTSPKIEHTFFLAWNACRRSGHTTDDFDAWLDKVDDIDPVKEPKAPLDRTRSRRSQSRSA